MERTLTDRGEERATVQAQPEPRQSSFVTYVLVMAISLISGAIGAMGYSHIFAPKPGEPSSSQSRTAAGSSRRSVATGADEGTQTNSAMEQGTATPETSQEAGELKQQIISLNKRIERLGERVDRLQELLSLAVPLLQRIAPKH